LAARYVRSGWGYRADLITERIPNAETLADRLNTARPIDWAAVGGLIARFHRKGLWHADLNAHNVLIDAHDRLWLIDLDRGQLRPPADNWMRGNLDRLRRSLLKLGAHERVEGFSASAWPQLLAAYLAG
jgi:3-deoxy-D-manno-octulosonic acid kinase